MTVERKATQPCKRDTQHEQVWSAFLFVFLEITSQEILQFSSKEILNLILFSCPRTSSKQDRDAGKIHLPRYRERAMSLSCCCCCCCAGQDCQLQPAVWSFIPPSDDKSSCGSKAAVSSEMICYGWSVMGCPSCASVPPLQINEKLCIAVNTALLPSTVTSVSPAAAASSACTAGPTWQQLSHIGVTSLLSCDKAVFWQEKAIQPWWPGAKQGLFSSSVKAAVTKRSLLRQQVDQTHKVSVGLSTVSTLQFGDTQCQFLYVVRLWGINEPV